MSECSVLHAERKAQPWLACFLTNLLSSDYFAMKKEEEELLELAEERENETPDIESDARDIVEEEFDTEFWVKVRKKHDEGIAWNRAVDEVRVDRLIKKYKDHGELATQDPTLLMLKRWPKAEHYQDNLDRLPSLEQLINRFLEILLESELNKDNRYETFRDEEDKTNRTLLHYAAEANFLLVTKTLVKKCPGLLALKTKAQLRPEKKRALLPVELALMADNDDVAAYLIRVMWHERVQSLFSWRPGNLKNPQPSYFSFNSIIQNPRMKKTVIAVLDQMVNPHWPHLPKRKDNYETNEEEDGIEGAWRTIPDDPLDYHFYYHILDGDTAGHPPKILSSESDKWLYNEQFDRKSKSCLHLIAKSKNKDALQHPVVRMLIKTKWQSYGHWFLCLQGMCYVIFLLALSYSLIFGSIRAEPTHYKGAADVVRGLCEILTLLMTVFYICEEVNQMRKERHSYFHEWVNLFDWLGLVLILSIIPLRFADRSEQWMVASLAFLFNFLRIFKFSCATRTTGLYTKTLAKIIRQDVTRFMAVFAVVFFSFCGSLFLSARSSKQDQPFSGFENVLLSGFRALSEQQPIAEDYSGFNWLSILLMLTYMGTVVVILLNILIAQMSTTYTQAKRVARLEYDVDRILLLARMERFPFLNLRVKYYKEGDWISEMKLAKELLEFSEDRHPWESIEEKLNAIRDMMRKMVKQMRQDKE